MCWSPIASVDIIMLSLQSQWLKPSDYTGNDCKTFNHPPASTAKETIHLLSWRINDVKINSTIPVAGWELTWPSACTLLQPQQICEGPCPPCSARCRRWWPPRRRSGAARTGWWPPAQCLQRRSAHTHGLHSLVDRFTSAEFTDRLKTPCSYGTWANFLPMWDHWMTR